MPYREKDFRDVLVGDVYEEFVDRPSIVKADAKIRDAIDQMLENPTSRKVYVVDAEGRYIGTVTTETVLRLLGYRVGIRETGGLTFFRFLRDTLKEEVGTIMIRTKTITKTARLTDALSIMLEYHLNDLPVVDEENKVIGELVSLELFLKGKKLFEETKTA